MILLSEQIKIQIVNLHPLNLPFSTCVFSEALSDSHVRLNKLFVFFFKRLQYAVSEK